MTEVVLSPEAVAWKTAQRVARTPFVPDVYQGKPEAVFAAILYGREIGMGPMQSLRAIHVIKGKPMLAPEAMRARVLAAGHTIDTVVYTDEVVTLRGQRADNGSVAEVSWTLDDARRARLIRENEPESSWVKYPRPMLLARTTSELCRLLFPDCISGLSYTPEELDDGQVVDVVEIEQPNLLPVAERLPPSSAALEGGSQP